MFSQTQDPSKRFQLPQYQAPSNQINQANSQVIKQNTVPSGDIYSGAKQGLETIKSGILDKTGGADLVDGDVHSPFITNDPPETNTPDYQVGKPQTGIKSGLDMSTENEALNLARKAYQSPALDSLSTSTDRANQLNRDVANYDPTKQPVSKLRKTAGIATGILTGLTGGGIPGAVGAYHAVTRAPAMDVLAQKQRLANEGIAEQTSALKNAEAVDKFGNTNKDLAKTVSDIGKIQQEGEIYNDTGRASKIAETGLAQANTQKALADTNVLNRPPEPKIVNSQPGEVARQQSFNMDTNQWDTKTLGEGQVKGIQKLSAGDEPIVRGYVSKLGKQPNDVIKGYENGDPASSLLVKEALDDDARMRNPSLSLGEPKQFFPTFDSTGKPTGGYIFDPRNPKNSAPISLKEMGMNEDEFVKNGPKSLAGTDKNFYEGANNTIDYVPKVLSQLKQVESKLGPLKGRINDFLTDKVGAYGPEFAKLQSELQNLASFVTANHTGRFSPAMIEEYKHAIGNVVQDPQNLESKLNAMTESAQQVRSQIEQMNPQALQVLSKNKSEKTHVPVKGDIEDGHIFLGGDPSKPENWKKQ